jgi:hypothetical protein
MQRKVVVAIGIVVVGGCLAAPPAVADDLPCGPDGNCQFLTPSGNISCSIDEGAPPGTQGSAPLTYCGTSSPPQSVVMDESGFFTLNTCDPVDCMGYPSPDTPTLAYGQMARNRMFSCLSETTGMTCTATASGNGFTISRSGVTAPEQVIPPSG